MVLGKLVTFTAAFLGRPAVVVVNGCIQDGLSVGRPGRVETNPADTFSCRKTAVGTADFGPGIAAIHAFPDGRSLPGFHKIPGAALTLPTACVQYIGISRVDDHINCTCIGVHIQCLLPGLATITGLVDTPLCIGRIQVPQCSYPGYLLVGGVEQDFADVVAFAEAAICPVLSTVSALVYACTRIGRATGVDLARTYPNGVIRPVNGNISDGHDGLMVEKGFETVTVVGGTPQAAGCIGYIKMCGILLPHINVNHATAHDGGPYVGKRYAIDNGGCTQLLPPLVGLHALCCRCKRRLGEILRVPQPTAQP